MSRIIYLHGFLSSPDSFKAKCTQRWLQESRPDIEYLCPLLSADPSESLETLDKLFTRERARDTFVIGSSLGGFWSTYVIERELAQKAALINPAVSPHTRFNEFVGKELQNYYTDDCYTLDDNDLAVLLDCDGESLCQIGRYYLLVQKGDEVLDYRQALTRYNGCKQTVEVGGNHGFEDYEKHLPDILSFFEL